MWYCYHGVIITSWGVSCCFFSNKIRYWNKCTILRRSLSLFVPQIQVLLFSDARLFAHSSEQRDCKLFPEGDAGSPACLLSPTVWLCSLQLSELAQSLNAEGVTGLESLRRAGSNSPSQEARAVWETSLSLGTWCTRLQRYRHRMLSSSKNYFKDNAAHPRSATAQHT
uniref:Uncharacterized protein n=1 Tax=Nothobranchius furzeri TaxID=105023 RepID=A0A1A8AH11_NOTFU